MGAGGKGKRSVWKRVEKRPQKSSHGLGHSPFHNIPTLFPGPAYPQTPRFCARDTLTWVADPGLSMSQGGWPAAAGAHSEKRVSGLLSDSVSNLPAAQGSVAHGCHDRTSSGGRKGTRETLLVFLQLFIGGGHSLSPDFSTEALLTPEAAPLIVGGHRWSEVRLLSGWTHCKLDSHRAARRRLQVDWGGGYPFPRPFSSKARYKLHHVPFPITLVAEESAYFPKSSVAW